MGKGTYSLLQAAEIMALPVVIAEAEIAAGMAGLQICKANTAHFCQKYTFKAEQVCSPPARHFHSWTPEGGIALSQETLLAPQVCVVLPGQFWKNLQDQERF